jgi:hypothetical protein
MRESRSNLRTWTRTPWLCRPRVGAKSAVCLTRRAGLSGFPFAAGQPAGTASDVARSSVAPRSWDYLAGLVELAAEISPGSVLVLGSARQRYAVDE